MIGSCALTGWPEVDELVVSAVLLCLSPSLLPGQRPAGWKQLLL